MISAVIQLPDGRETEVQIKAAEPPPVLRVTVDPPKPGAEAPPVREFAMVRMLPSGRALYRQARTDGGLYTGVELGL